MANKRKAAAADDNEDDMKQIADMVARAFLKKLVTGLTGHLGLMTRIQAVYWHDLIKLINDELALLGKQPISSVVPRMPV